MLSLAYCVIKCNIRCSTFVRINHCRPVSWWIYSFSISSRIISKFVGKRISTLQPNICFFSNSIIELSMVMKVYQLKLSKYFLFVKIFASDLLTQLSALLEDCPFYFGSFSLQSWLSGNRGLNKVIIVPNKGERIRHK